MVARGRLASSMVTAGRKEACRHAPALAPFWKLDVSDRDDEVKRVKKTYKRRQPVTVTGPRGQRVDVIAGCGSGAGSAADVDREPEPDVKCGCRARVLASAQMAEVEYDCCVPGLVLKSNLRRLTWPRCGGG